jgi:hypothetical protein
MANKDDFRHSERVDVQKLDNQGIEAISSAVARTLTKAAAAGAEAQGKFHIRIGFGKSSGPKHTEIIIGNPEPDEPAGKP